jgi:hypothetical protein
MFDAIVNLTYLRKYNHQFSFDMKTNFMNHRNVLRFKKMHWFQEVHN